MAVFHNFDAEMRREPKDEQEELNPFSRKPAYRHSSNEARQDKSKDTLFFF